MLDEAIAHCLIRKLPSTYPGKCELQQFCVEEGESIPNPYLIESVGPCWWRGNFWPCVRPWPPSLPFVIISSEPPKSEGIAVYYVLHIILCLPIFIEGREGHLAYKGSLIFMWIFVQINWDPLCSCRDFWQRRRDLDQILARQPALNDEDDMGWFVEVTVPWHHDGQLYFKRASVEADHGNVL